MAGRPSTAGAVLALLAGAPLWTACADDVHTAEAPIVSLEAEPATFFSSSEGEVVEGHTLRAVYEVEGTRYTLVEEEQAYYDPEERYKVCYDPANPQDGVVYLASRECGAIF